MEEKLLKATEHILPETAESKTATELAELCRLVQNSTRQKLLMIKNKMQFMGSTTRIDWGGDGTGEERTNHESDRFSQVDSATPIHWAVGGPLESVVEGDVETEGATTPGSILQPSPFHGAARRKSSLTPTTPTMDTFSFR